MQLIPSHISFFSDVVNGMSDSTKLYIGVFAACGALVILVSHFSLPEWCVSVMEKESEKGRIMLYFDLLNV